MFHASAKVTSKGQVTLPAKVRQRLGVKPGDRIDFVEDSSGNIEIVARTHTLADLRGIVRHEGPPLSNEDIVRMIDEARSQRADAILKAAGISRR